MNSVNVREVIKKAGVKSIVAAIAVIAFFVAIIISFYLIMYASVKNNIRLEGNDVAIESAERFDRYLITSANLVKLETYMIDEMIKDGATHDDLQNYIVEETQRIQKSINKDYTGLYGYIMDVYHDGANWVPPEDYLPTDRPWYNEALKKKGEVAIIQPYVDAQTDAIVTTIAMALADEKGVVALDISFDMIQKVTDDMEQGSKKPLQIILDDNGTVVAHSFVEQIGHNYIEEKKSMGGLIAKGVFGKKRQSFEIKYHGNKYMVYSIPISNGWYSISVINTTDRYTSLNIMLVVALVVLVITVCILNVLFIYSSSKSIRAEKLNHQLATTANIYMSVYDIDFINDKAEEIKSSIQMVKNISREKRNGANKSFQNIFDHIPDNPTKKSIKEFVDFSTLEERLADKETIATEYISFGNKWCRGRFVVSERTDDGKLSHVMWVVEDIDKEKRSKEKLVDISEKAVAASEAKSAFLSNMSHEIRTPINAMLGLNEMMLRECEDKDLLSYAIGINTAGHTLLGIVNDILDFSKIEAGKMEIIPVDYSLASTLNDLVNMVHTRADEKGLLVNINVENDIPDKLHGDEIRVKQIITNILTNAVKYTEKGSVTFTVKYSKIDDPENQDSIMLKVAVADTGIGIKEEDMGKLFSEFDRIEEKRNRNIEGTGLGMAITQNLLKMMDSTLKVRSEYGKGSEFSFEIVQKVVDWKEIGDYENTYKDTALRRKGYKEKFRAPTAKVLVVDDTPLNLTVFKSLLKKTRIQIDTAERGKAAINKACHTVYDVIFLDHMMPEMDGIETLKELMTREDNLNKETPIICLTANAISGSREKYLTVGFDDYLTKPIDSEKLEEMLVTYLPEDKVIMTNDEIEYEPEDQVEVPSFVYEVDGLDVDEAISHCGSSDTYMEILRAFADMIEGCADETENLWNNRELKDAAVKIHAIKSQVRTIGAFELGDFAEMLEMAAKEEDEKTLSENIEELLTKSRELGKKFESLKTAEIDNDDSLPDISEEDLKELFTKINEYIEDFDSDNIEEAVASFRKYHIPDDYVETVKQLMSLADNLDYDEMQTLIASII